jgi:glyoxylase-like metal-dependent hydrolase (beta-lactamase superfamily II)
MQEILPNLFLIDGMTSNAYLLVAADGLLLVDSGPPHQAPHIVDQLAQGGYSLSDLRSLVLTHAHADHTGSATELVRLSGAQVIAYRAEVPYLEQTERLPIRGVASRALQWLQEHVLPAVPACHVDVVLENRDVLEGSDGFVAVHAPGHTPGSLCLYHPGKRIVICGDAIFNRHSITGQRGLRYPLPLVSSDISQARESVRRLAALPIEHLCCGHGAPILEDAGARIRELVARGK